MAMALICFTHNKGKSFVAGRFIRTLKSKIYRHMNAVPQNMYINNLDGIVDKDNKNITRKNEYETCWCSFELIY